MMKVRSFSTVYFLSIVTIVILVSLTGIGSWVLNSYSEFESQAEVARKQFVNNNTVEIEYQVNRGVNYIEHQLSRAESLAKTQVQENVNKAVVVAQATVDELHEKLNPLELERLVMEILRPIRFNDGQGYFFATRLDGTELLFADRPEFEGINLLDMQSPDGSFVIQDMITLIQSKKEGFYEYLWTKPGEEGNDHLKIAYIKYFEPFDCFIGSGVYLEDIISSLQQSILDWLVEVRFGENGYLFGSTFEGDPLFTNGEITKGGPTVWDLTDPNGVKIIQRQREIVRDPEGGFLEYSWRKLKNDAPSKKLVFVRSIPKMNWIIGSGFYLDDVEAAISIDRKEHFEKLLKEVRIASLVGLGLLIIAILFAWFFSSRMKHQLSMVTTFLSNATTSNAPMDPLKLSMWEFRTIGESVNTMLKSKEKIENELRDEITLTNNILDTMQDTFFLFEASTGKAIRWNKAFTNTVKYSDSEIVNLKAPLSYYSEKDLQKAEKFLKELPTKKNNIIDLSLITSKGEHIPFEYSSTIFSDDKGNQFIISIGRNVTERKQAEELIQNVKAYLTNIIDSMPSILIGIDSDNMIIHWNKEAQRKLGLSYQDVIGKNLYDVVPYLANEIDRFRSSSSTGEVSAKIRLSHEDNGEIRYQDVVFFPLAHDKEEGWVIRMDDITDRVHLEQMMVQTEKMMSLGGLAAGMAHEINNPLAGIMGNTQNITNRVFGDLKKNRSVAQECGIDLEGVRTYLERRDIPKMLVAIRESTERAATIISNMLSFSRSGDQSQKPEDLAQLLETTLKLIAYDYDMKKKYDFKNIEIVREYDLDLPFVQCVGNDIQQVFFNLLRNGAEAMADKEYYGDAPKFILKIRKEDKSLRIEIEDNGIGMNETTLSRVFEPFFTTKDIGKGTGLGLSVSYFIVTEQHNGTMAVFSKFGEWTRFVIALPIGGKQIKEYGL